MRIEPFDDFDPDDPDIEFRKNRWNYWNTIKQISDEYKKDIEALQLQFGHDDFPSYVEKNYGIRMSIVDNNITDKYDIVDEQLYTLFLLKWT